MLRNSRAILTGLGLGAGLMYFLDPERGGRRRAFVRDKAAHATRVGVAALGAAGMDLSNRASGLMAQARGALRSGPVDDGVLVERVRAKLGRLVSHPHAVDVKAIDGCVHLRGPVLQAEVPRLVRAVARVPGVRDVINALDAHPNADGVPALQSVAPLRARPAVWQRS
jgi:osmotically-inducible protein OsmY